MGVGRDADSFSLGYTGIIIISVRSLEEYIISGMIGKKRTENRT